MATMCKWGDIKFSVTSEKVLTFRNFKRESSASWTNHDIVGKRPKMEYLGPEMDEITLEVILDAEYGVSPRTQMYKFRDACKSGDVNYLYINGSKVCYNKMYISKVSESWDEIWSNGELVRATDEITFAEYR